MTGRNSVVCAVEGEHPVDADQLIQVDPVVPTHLAFEANSRQEV